MRVSESGLPAKDDDPRPVLSTAAVRWACCTMILLAVLGVLAVAAWHRPDDAVRAVVVLWAGVTDMLGLVVIVGMFLVLSIFLR